jgi:AmmeMemoRadiSam system protein A
VRCFCHPPLGGKLRGCIGNISSKKPLWQTIREMAKEAAFNDPEVFPLSNEELKKVEIEISVLSPLKKIESIEEIVVGKHGLFISHGHYQGLLLPQVAIGISMG